MDKYKLTISPNDLAWFFTWAVLFFPLSIDNVSGMVVAFVSLASITKNSPIKLMAYSETVAATD